MSSITAAASAFTNAYSQFVSDYFLYKQNNGQISLSQVQTDAATLANAGLAFSNYLPVGAFAGVAGMELSLNAFKADFNTYAADINNSDVSAIQLLNAQPAVVADLAGFTAPSVATLSVVFPPLAESLLTISGAIAGLGAVASISQFLTSTPVTNFIESAATNLNNLTQISPPSSLPDDYFNIPVSFIPSAEDTLGSATPVTTEYTDPSTGLVTLVTNYYNASSGSNSGQLIGTISNTYTDNTLSTLVSTNATLVNSTSGQISTRNLTYGTNGEASFNVANFGSTNSSSTVGFNQIGDITGLETGGGGYFGNFSRSSRGIFGE